jgi:hypothetical protein
MRVKSVRRQQSELKRHCDQVLPNPFTGNGFVIKTAVNGKLSVYFTHAFIELHESADNQVVDILGKCEKMAKLQAEWSSVRHQIDQLGVTHAKCEKKAKLQAERSRLWHKICRVGALNGFQVFFE